MRSLKFRIWDKQFNKFLYQLPEKYHLDWERFDIQQFTGLADKQGKEIYEGDILKHREQIAKLKFNQELAIFEAEGISIFLDGVEIIGNIYETPSLIECLNKLNK